MTEARRFAYRLAVALGEPSVDHMLQKMTWRELVEWRLFSNKEPLGGRRMDYLFALLRADIHNLTRSKDEEPVDPMDLLPRFAETPEERERRMERKSEQVPQKLKRILGNG